jgi:small-conductance mechanosensitive channel
METLSELWQTHRSMLEQMIVSLSFIAGGIIAGILIEKLIFIRLRKIPEKTGWEGAGIMIDALRGIPRLCFIIAGIYGAVANGISSPLLLDILSKLLIAILVMTITFIVARMSVGLVNLYTKGKEGILPSTTIFTTISRLCIYVIGTLIMLQSIGVSIAPILTALGVGGLAVALALKDTLSNLFSGLQIIVSRQIKPDDYIKLSSGEEGFVTDVAWRNTTIRQTSNNMVVIPNSKLAESVITNFSLPEKTIKVTVDITVSPASNLEKVEKATIEAAKLAMKNFAGTVKDFTPSMKFISFTGNGVNFTVELLAADVTNMKLIRHEFIKLLLQKYRREKIEISAQPLTVPPK